MLTNEQRELLAEWDREHPMRGSSRLPATLDLARESEARTAATLARWERQCPQDASRPNGTGSAVQAQSTVDLSRPRWPEFAPTGADSTLAQWEREYPQDPTTPNGVGSYSQARPGSVF